MKGRERESVIGDYVNVYNNLSILDFELVLVDLGMQ